MRFRIGMRALILILMYDFISSAKSEEHKRESKVGHDVQYLPRAKRIIKLLR